MKIMNRHGRMVMLEPLVRRKKLKGHKSKMLEAVHSFNERALADSLLADLTAQGRTGDSVLDRQWKDPNEATARVEFITALYLARKISFAEYIFAVAINVDWIHSERISVGTYPELEALSAKIRSIEAAHGLSQDEFWLVNEGPPEYRQHTGEWDRAADLRFAEILHELGAPAAHSIFVNNQDEFDRLVERGRRAIFHKDDAIPVIVDTVVRYEAEAKIAASAKAYTAAVILLGAATEGLLLVRCLRSPVKASQTAAKLPKHKQPRDLNPERWTFDTLIQVCLIAGWLPQISTPSLVLKPDGLAHLLRKMRNYVHPGRVSAERPWLEVDKHDFDDAEAIFLILLATINKPTALKNLP